MSRKQNKSGLKETLEQINKKLGEDLVNVYSDFGTQEIPRLRTGSIGMDIITGGGWARGLMNYISGWESSGKSTLATYAIANTQKEGGVAAYIDHEYSFDKTYAESLGVDVDNMILAQPGSIEQGYDIALDLLASGHISILVFDSIAAAIPEKDLDGDTADQSMGIKARINSKVFPQLCSLAKKNGVTLIMINQLREKIGVMFGSPITEPGGNALKFYPSIKVTVQQATKIKGEGDAIDGNLVRAKCTKNKTSKPFRETEYNIIYGTGIDRTAEILYYGEKLGLIVKSGSWFSLCEELGGTKIGQGANKALEMLHDNPELSEQIEKVIYENLDQF